MKVRFLLDENLSPRIKQAVQRREPAIDLLRVGDENAPPLGTLDPDILRYLESAQRLLLTDNRATIPAHLIDHTAAGGRHWGIVWLRAPLCIGLLAEWIHTIWAASEAEEWIDQTGWLP